MGLYFRRSICSKHLSISYYNRFVDWQPDTLIPYSLSKDIIHSLTGWSYILNALSL